MDAHQTRWNKTAQFVLGPLMSSSDPTPTSKIPLLSSQYSPLFNAIYSNAWGMPVLFFLVDMFVMTATVAAFVHIDPAGIGGAAAQVPLEIPIVAALVCIWFALEGHYTERRSALEDIRRAGSCILMVCLVYVSIAGRVGFIWLPAVLTVSAGRFIVRWLLHVFGLYRPVLIIGPHRHCSGLRLAIDNAWYRGFRVEELMPCNEIRYAQIAPRLVELADNGAIEHVMMIIDQNVDEVSRITALVHDLGLTLSIAYWPACPEAHFVVDHFFGSEIAAVREVLLAPWPCARSRVKRALDLVISVAALVVMAPLFCAIAGLVKYDGGPVFYASPRIGAGGKVFMALKFRTMVEDADRALQDLLAGDPKARTEWETTFKLRADPRITPIGRLLRRFSLDELPQIINVIRGQMSLVGPRPILLMEREAYGQAFETYCKCIPGITGPWQISGRNDLDYCERIELNAWYARHASIWVDLVILFRTIPIVLRGAGAV